MFDSGVLAIEQGAAIKGSRVSDAQVFFEGFVEQARQNGAGIVIVEMNDPLLMTKRQLKQDEGRPYHRVDNIAYVCGSPNAKKGGLGFQMVDAAYGQAAFEGEKPVLHLALGVKILDPKLLDADGKLPTQVYLATVRDFFASFKDIEDEARAAGKTPREIAEANPTYLAIKESVAGRESLDLLGAGARRTHLG
jgi:hypothetical protein